VGAYPGACRSRVSGDDQRSIAGRPAGSSARPGRGDSWLATG